MATPTTLPASFTSGQVLTAAQMNNLRGAFRILQVVQTVKTDTFTTTSATFSDVTGLTATITPSSTSSKILIMAQVSLSSSDIASVGSFARINGGNANTYVGNAASNRIQAAAAVTVVASFANSYGVHGQSIVYLDSPATTSATTYAVQVRSNAITTTTFINRTGVDTDSAAFGRVPSSITVMEISA